MQKILISYISYTCASSLQFVQAVRVTNPRLTLTHLSLKSRSPSSKEFENEIHCSCCVI